MVVTRPVQGGMPAQGWEVRWVRRSSQRWQQPGPAQSASDKQEMPLQRRGGGKLLGTKEIRNAYVFVIAESETSPVKTRSFSAG